MPVIGMRTSQREKCCPCASAYCCTFSTSQFSLSSPLLAVLTRITTQSSEFRLRNQSLHSSLGPLHQVGLHASPGYHELESRIDPRLLPPQDDLLSSPARLVLPLLRHSTRYEILAIKGPPARLAQDDLSGRRMDTRRNPRSGRVGSSREKVERSWSGHSRRGGDRVGFIRGRICGFCRRGEGVVATE